MKKYLTVISESDKETKILGLAFARELLKTSFKTEAPAVALKGELGSGKTTFVLGFLKYFGIKPHAASPTFVIMKKYSSKKRSRDIYHLHAYR